MKGGDHEKQKQNGSHFRTRVRDDEKGGAGRSRIRRAARGGRVQHRARRHDGERQNLRPQSSALGGRRRPTLRKGHDALRSTLVLPHARAHRHPRARGLLCRLLAGAAPRRLVCDEHDRGKAPGRRKGGRSAGAYRTTRAYGGVHAQGEGRRLRLYTARLAPHLARASSTAMPTR